jgi:XTP/dITP diphosphohydrolase
VSTHDGPDAARDAVADLVEVMDRLRSPGGCPWDAEQTHASLLPYAIEEVFEVVEAVETGDRLALREELGDLLLQVVFHARVAQEHATDPFGLDEVAAGIAAKLRHRHPHVFGDVEVADAEDVHRRWELIKKAEKARESALDGIPPGMPALARAEKVIGRARRAGLPVAETVTALVADAGRGPGGAPAGGSPADSAPEVSPTVSVEARLRAELLTLALRAQEAGVDAEAVLRGAVRDLEGALRGAEADATSAETSRHD